MSLVLFLIIRIKKMIPAHARIANSLLFKISNVASNACLLIPYNAKIKREAYLSTSNPPTIRNLNRLTAENLHPIDISPFKT